MDIYDYLKKDHQKVEKLFKLYTNTNDSSYQVEIVDMLSRELRVHSQSEQKTFYKALKGAEAKIINHAQNEHADIENQLNKIASLDSSDEAWKAAVLKLKSIVEHHVNEEEGEIFEKAQKILTNEEAMIIKEQMHDYKYKISITIEGKNKEMSSRHAEKELY